MKKARKTYSIFQSAAAVFMILALLWLTVSAPFVYSYQQKVYAQEKASAPIAIGDDEETANPFGNSTEEKASNSSSSFSEEYLHDHHVTDHFFSVTGQYHKCEDAGTYIAFHGELLVPPPNIA